MWHDLALLAHPSWGYRVCGVDPAVGVHDTTWNAVNDAVDGVTDILSRRDYKRRDDEYDERRFIVKPEHIAEQKTILLLCSNRARQNGALLSIVQQVFHKWYSSLGRIRKPYKDPMIVNHSAWRQLLSRYCQSVPTILELYFFNDRIYIRLISGLVVMGGTPTRKRSKFEIIYLIWLQK